MALGVGAPNALEDRSCFYSPFTGREAELKEDGGRELLRDGT